MFSGFIDEANFMKTIRSKEDGKWVDQATENYNAIKARIKYQFENFATGEWPGKLYLASSANHSEDFTQTRKKKAKKVDYIYVVDYPLWEVKDTDKYSGKKFWVKPPNELSAGRVFKKKPRPMDDDIIEIPIEMLDTFEDDLAKAIQEVAGKPILRDSKFIPSSYLIENFEKYEAFYGFSQIFNTFEVDINQVNNLKSLFNIPFIEAINNYGKFHSHNDLSLHTDNSGIAIGAAMGSKIVSAKNVFNEEKEQFEKEVEAFAPIYVIFGLLKIVPPLEGEIKREKIWEMFFALKEHLTNLDSWSADFAYSTTISQMLRKVGIATARQSVDKQPDPYIEMKTSLSESRLWLPENEMIKSEVKGLKQDMATGKIDHDINSEKDVADAIAGCVYRLSQRKATYNKKGKPVTLREMLKMKTTDTNKRRGRFDKSNRPSSGNRPAHWQLSRGRRSLKQRWEDWEKKYSI